jgi:predicted ATPase
MLTKLMVQSFKSLRSVEVPLGIVNVFIGANGSGKSNLLEAVGLSSAAASGQVDDQALLRRGVRPGTPTSYASSFKSGPAPEALKIVARFDTDEGTVEHEVSVTSLTVVGQEASVYTEQVVLIEQSGQRRYHSGRLTRVSGTPLRVSETRENNTWATMPDAVRNVSDCLYDYAIFAPTTPVLRGTISDSAQREPVGLAGGQLAVAVRDLLKPRQRKLGSVTLDELFTLLDWVEEIAVVPPTREIVSPSVPTLSEVIRFTDRWMADDRNRLSAYDASEGALYVLFALVLALHPKAPRLFAVEHLDHNMHPRLARATMRLFCELMLRARPERQALLTTHNPLVLDGLNLRDDRIRLFTVERDAEGATRVDRVPVSDEMLRAIENGLSLSSLWVMGRLGGVPDLF